ncbi:hypothetical protein CBR_g49090 [Chara braunii]|uniref:Integrase catalytic domain-containing protein n=1 Tax=Chara braunii TaxID=69332 RepID=A0A388K4Q3_CHABU|nr:hypothetical protein CBR_g49090 [Chara braunii]|eukprot:GBG65021.1 hypothetical protein CBR_g49090 [Chara braunii]
MRLASRLARHWPTTFLVLESGEERKLRREARERGTLQRVKAAAANAERALAAAAAAEARAAVEAAITTASAMSQASSQATSSVTSSATRVAAFATRSAATAGTAAASVAAATSAAAAACCIAQPMQQAQGAVRPMQWTPQAPLFSPKPFSGDRKDKVLDTRVRTLPTAAGTAAAASAAAATSFAASACSIGSQPRQQAQGAVQPMQWTPKIPLLSSKPFSGDKKKDEDMDIWVKTVPICSREKVLREEENTRGALRVPHVFQALDSGEERRLRRARALAAGIAAANPAVREQATTTRAAAMANGASSAPSSSASSSGTNGGPLGMPTSSTSSSGTSGSTGSRQSSSQMAGSQLSPLTPRQRELREIQHVEMLRRKLEQDLKEATDRENAMKTRAARLESLEADKAELEGLDESALTDPLKVLKKNMLSLHAHVDNKLDFMQSILDQIVDALTKPGFRPPAQSSLPLSAMSGPFPVQAGTQPSENIRNLLASEARTEYHSFETLSRKALDLEATLGNAQPTSGNDLKKKKSPQEWKKKGAKLMMVESDRTQTEIDELSDLMDYSEYDGEEVAEGSTLVAVVKTKAADRGKGQPRGQGKAASNQTKQAEWVKACLEQDVWRDRRTHGACINCGEYEHSQYKCQNAKVTQKHAMNRIFHDHLDKFVVVYLDDILIFIKSAEEHAKHVETVLSLLRQHRYKVNLEKCEFGRTKILYLGHEVSEEGIRPEDAKVASIRDWPRPQTVTEVRSFLGMCGYYRNFVKNYSTVASPLTDVTRLDTPWDWSDECEGAFKKLKYALMNHEVLMVPDPQKPFIVTTDASQFGIGAVLAQQDGKKLRPIEYMSKKMPSKKLAKSTYERELYALYKALVHWRHFLLGRFFYLRIDHQTLKWIKTHPALSDALKRWIEVIEQYDFKLEYLKGEYNKVADALSRRADCLGVLVSDFGVSNEVTQSLVGAYQEDLVTMDFIRKLQAKDKATERSSVSMDFMDTLVTSKSGKRRIFVIIDRFTKYARLIPMPETTRTKYVIKLFKDNWVRDFGLPKTIVSDRDVRFTSELWKKTAEQMGSQLQMTSGNHPEANGQAEQMNRVVQHLLRHYIKPNQNDWDEQLPLIASLYNNVVHSSTGVSPNQLHLGWKPRSALDFLLPENRPAATPDTLEYGVQYEKLMQAVEHIKKAQQAMIASENEHRRQSTFQQLQLRELDAVLPQSTPKQVLLGLLRWPLIVGNTCLDLLLNSKFPLKPNTYWPLVPFYSSLLQRTDYEMLLALDEQNDDERRRGGASRRCINQLPTNTVQVFYTRGSKGAFVERGVEVLLFGDGEDLAKVLKVGLEGGVINKDIVEVYDDTNFKEAAKDVVHGGLECGGGVVGGGVLVTTAMAGVLPSMAVTRREMSATVALMSLMDEWMDAIMWRSVARSGAAMGPAGDVNNFLELRADLGQCRSPQAPAVHISYTVMLHFNPRIGK